MFFGLFGMYRFEESRRVKPLTFKEAVPRYLSVNDFLLHFKDEIFKGGEAMCEFELTNFQGEEYLDMEQTTPFVIRRLYKQKFHKPSDSPVMIKKVEKKRKRRWRSNSPPRRRRRWVSPDTRRA